MATGQMSAHHQTQTDWVGALRQQQTRQSLQWRVVIGVEPVYIHLQRSFQSMYIVTFSSNFNCISDLIVVFVCLLQKSQKVGLRMASGAPCL